MKYCKRCLYPANHPLKICFDQSGICSGCRVHEEKDVINWDTQFIKLKSIIEPYKKSARSINNCIIPVSGARDSYFIVHIVKNILGLNPLLVTYNKQYNTKIGIRNISYLKTLFGCPIFTMTVNPDCIKKITIETIEQIGSIYWHCIAGQTVFPVQLATKFKIPLIIWGAHQGVDQVGMFSHYDEVEMTRKYRKEHDLMNLEGEDFINSGSLSDEDLQHFLYPHDKEIEAVGVRGIYLNNYIRWDSKTQHEQMIKLYNYETDEQERTFDCYNDIDCYHYSGLHDFIKYVKWGYGKVTDHASREIRLKRMTRNEGIELVKRYSLEKPKDMELFCKWIGMNEKEFMGKINNFRSESIWEKKKNDWKLKDNIINHMNDSGVENLALNKIEDCVFNSKSKRTDQKEINDYTLLGRGWIT